MCGCSFPEALGRPTYMGTADTQRDAEQTFLAWSPQACVLGDRKCVHIVTLGGQPA